MADYLNLKRSSEDVVRNYFGMLREAEENRPREYHAAIVIQAFWRGERQRKLLRVMRHAALSLQKVVRGHWGRIGYKTVLVERLAHLRRERFNGAALKIQAVFRGHKSRRNVHNFAKRKEYLKMVEEASGRLRKEMDERIAEQMKDREKKAIRKEEIAMNKALIHNHHLVGTFNLPGVYSHPTRVTTRSPDGTQREEVVVFDEMLHSVTKNLAKQKLSETMKKRRSLRKSLEKERNASSRSTPFVEKRATGPFKRKEVVERIRAVPPKPSLRMELPYDAPKEARIQAEKESIGKWVGGRDFLHATYTTEDAYVTSVHEPLTRPQAVRPRSPPRVSMTQTKPFWAPRPAAGRTFDDINSSNPFFET